MASNSKNKPPTTSSDGSESRRWREGAAAPRDARFPRRSTRAAAKPVVGLMLESFLWRGSRGKPYVWACTSWAGTRSSMKFMNCLGIRKNWLRIGRFRRTTRPPKGSRGGKRRCRRSRRSGSARLALERLRASRREQNGGRRSRFRRKSCRWALFRMSPWVVRVSQAAEASCDAYPGKSVS